MEEFRREVLRENEQHPEGMALMQRADLPAREGLHCPEPGEIDAAATRPSRTFTARCNGGPRSSAVVRR